jgi:hypothetical protein
MSKWLILALLALGLPRTILTDVDVIEPESGPLYYGLSLVVIHQVLWNVGPSLGHHPPASAVDFADQFGDDWRELALRTYTSAIAMVIGAGTSLVAAFIAVAAARWRRMRNAR